MSELFYPNFKNKVTKIHVCFNHEDMEICCSFSPQKKAPIYRIKLERIEYLNLSDVTDSYKNKNIPLQFAPYYENKEEFVYDLYNVLNDYLKERQTKNITMFLDPIERDYKDYVLITCNLYLGGAKLLDVCEIAKGFKFELVQEDRPYIKIYKKELQDKGFDSASEYIRDVIHKEYNYTVDILDIKKD